MISVQHWLANNKAKLANKWERMFVEQVLCKVDNLDVASLEAQMQFRDRDGRQRYADFAIAEGDHLRIVMEVDGYDKRGRGSGMTSDEFVDWQRRQNALAAQGWFVLRFANRDVRDHPDRCAEHIALLLREKRHDMEHHKQLHRSIIELEKNLDRATSQVAEAQTTYGEQLEEERRKLQSAERKQVRLKQDLEKAKREMALAEKAPELNREEENRLNRLNREQQNEIDRLTGEQSTMKTTIWAFTLLIISAMVLLVYVLNRQNDQNSIDAAAPGTEYQSAAPLGQNCQNPAGWLHADRYIGQRVALRGPVAGISYRPQTRGQPTWINVGADFPDRNRLVLVIWGRNRAKLSSMLNQIDRGGRICAVGEVSDYQGVPQIEIESADQIQRLAF